MSQYNLTEQAKKSLISIIESIETGKIDEEFYVYGDKQLFLWTPRIDRGIKFNAGIAALKNLEKEGLIAFKGQSSDLIRGKKYKYQLDIKAYKAVESSFNHQDICVFNLNHLDNELKIRCLTILSAGSTEPTLWDSAVRTAGVILEERLRQKGAIGDPNIIGQDLVNKIFSKTGTLASKFTIDSERQGYRDLYSGIIGSYRNPSAHRLIDPTPEEGGAFIIFIDLLLKKLDNL